MRGIEDISGFHAHIYYGHPSGWWNKPYRPHQKYASELREYFTSLIDDGTIDGGNVRIGSMHDELVGPHTQPMFQIQIGYESISLVFQLLILNHKELSVLIHPLTGNALEEHSNLAMWLGNRIPLDFTKL